MSKIIHVSTLRPKYKYTTEEIIAAADERWLSKVSDRERRLAIKLFKGAEIEERYSVAGLDVVFGDLSFEEKNDLYREAMIELGTQVMDNALKESGIDPSEIDTIITTSCTGFMIPSVDAYIINNLGLNQGINRLPVTEMGCAGGTSGLIYASQFLKANPKAKIALVSVETPSLTFQKQDMSVENLVSTAIFADGASCVILGETELLRPEIIATDMYHFKDADHLMGYHLKNEGLKIILDRDVPNQIEEHFPNILLPFLKKNGFDPIDVDRYMFHPGGKKIINMVILNETIQLILYLPTKSLNILYGNLV